MSHLPVTRATDIFPKLDGTVVRSRGDGVMAVNRRPESSNPSPSTAMVDR